MHRILICDPLDASGLAILEESGAEIDRLDPADKPRLAELIGAYDAIVVRSGTQVTAELLAAGERLRVVARAGIGVDNVDVAAATERGILVVNAPTANLISATEHTFALLLALARRVAAADASMRRGEWNRKGYLGVELAGKTLGVVGFGRIGQAVARRAQAFDMQVVAFDPFLDASVGERLGVELLELDELLGRAEVVTLHTPLTSDTRGLLSAERIGRMRPGAILVNCARGGIVDEEALLAALEDDHLAGAALDVFSEEPPRDRRLVEHPKVVTTPHIGAQTREAQERVSTQTARMLLAALDGSLSITAVNLPFRSAGSGHEPLMELGERLGRLAGTLLAGPVTKLHLDLWGIAEEVRSAVTVAVLKGALAPSLGDGINFVNAERQAKDRGWAVVQSTHSESGDYSHLIAVRLEGREGAVELAGTLSRGRDPRVVSIEGYRLEFRPQGRLLLLRNRDVPGVVGKLGMTLGAAGINIADIHLARRREDETALAVLRLDQEPSDELRRSLAELSEVEDVRYVGLGGD